MNANELRINNWVGWNGPSHYENALVSAISKDEIFFKCGDSGLINEIEPILLTEKWLLRFGFEKIIGKIDIYEKGRLRIWVGSRGQSLCYLIEEDTTSAHYIPNSIEYVHQIQNLYFALFGEELN
jgi:hypothetical protein